VIKPDGDGVPDRVIDSRGAWRLSACFGDLVDVLLGEPKVFSEEPAWHRAGGGASTQP
jgi:hypothetical protein